LILRKCRGRSESENFDEGLVGYLVLQAQENPTAFMGLLGKILPHQVLAEVTKPVAEVTDEIMTPEEWAEQWAKRMTS
jgi:hypothetical protein